MQTDKQGTVDRAAVERESSRLKARIETLRGREDAATRDHLADAAIYQKAAEWALRFEPSLVEADIRQVNKTLSRGFERAAALESGSAKWDGKRGRLVRGYRSEVDGSVQPYGLIIPHGYDPAKPIRLDVVLHGSTRPVGMSETRFMQSFDEGDFGDTALDNDYIELHPLGRVENCYRWAGETDVFEAIEDVCRHYNVDRDRLVLRGMSMGASGTWHLGLKWPDRFVSLGPYCGYVDTHRFSETPGMNFVKVGPLPEYQEEGLHMLDSVDYAANAGVVPAIAAIGEKDPFFQAHVIMGEAMRREGLKMVNLISPGTGHVQEPVTFGEQMRRIGEYAARGIDHSPRRIRFVTWTLKYNRCHWIEILGLDKHYARAEVDASVAADGVIQMKQPLNVTRLAIYPFSTGIHVIEVEGKRIRVPLSSGPKRGIVIERRGGRWRFAGMRTDGSPLKLSGKRPGVQGPIDDAFTKRFLCVRGTGKPWNPSIGAWADANLRRFSYEWARYFRGDLPIKDDTAVTEGDRRTCNLILFGDPGSNRLIRESLSKLPIRWSRQTLRMGDSEFPAANHAPELISESPFAPDHYVVVNSGHTFHEAELNRLNYLLFPRLGDWAVLKIGNSAMSSSPSDPLPEEALQAGYFDEKWRFPEKVRQP